MMPRDAISQCLEERGGITKLNSPADIPHNRQQVANYRSKYGNTGAHDELAILVHMANNSKDSDTAFVRSVSITPEKSVFCATDQQLKDVERFCTKSFKFCILGVDPTYNLGPCYATLTTYRHLLLRTKDGEHPVMLGPLLLHTRKTYDSYFNLPSNMIKLNPLLNGILVTGTDSEENVFRPFSDLCSAVLNQYCSIHCYDNVKDKVKDVPSIERQQIMKDLFGKTNLDTHIKGVVDAEGELEFGELLNNFCEKWAKFPNLIAYIVTEKEEVMKTSMRADVRSICGLGYPPKTYTQNANECMNRWVKDKLTKPLKSFSDVIKLIEEEVKRQTDQVSLSLSGNGEWTLDPSLKGSKFDIGIKFYQKTSVQRRNFLKAFNEFVQEPPKDSRGGNTPGTPTLSISANDSGLLFPPMEVLNEMFNKAAVLLENDNAIVRAPGVSEGLFFVVSNNANSPHKVAAVDKGRVSCDCTNFKSFKICRHSLAVAEREGKLGEFLKIVKRKKRTADGAINATGPSDSGKKARRATQVRKGTQRKNSSKQPTFSATPVPLLQRYPDPEIGSFSLAIIQLCHGNTKICYTCRNQLGGKPITDSLEYSNDLVVVSKAHRVVGREADGSLAYSHKVSNVFFHAYIGHIRIQFPQFAWSMVTIFEPHRSEILQNHDDFLRRVGII